MSNHPSWRLGHPVRAAPHHRHQASLEGILDMSLLSLEPLAPAARQAARQTFYRIVEHFAAVDPSPAPGSVPPPRRTTTYSHPLLIRYTYEYALSDESRDVFLRAFFNSMALTIDGVEGINRLDDNNPVLDFEELAPLFAGFAEYLMDNFFLPLKASTRKTPQPSPAFHSAVLRAQGDVSAGAAAGFVETPDRLSSLRGVCLVRDHYRCVISRKFHGAYFMDRLLNEGPEARDDEGHLLSDVQQGQLDNLEVAHILPHSLMKAAGSEAGEPDAARQAALAILNMFDKGVVHMIDGVDIDRARNALTLTPYMHMLFGSFQVYFEPVLGSGNTYRIQSFFAPQFNNVLGLPTTRTLVKTEDCTIDPPSPRLLAVHRAIAHILHLSGAGDYIERVLYDMEDSVVRSDGTSQLGRIVQLRLSGWVDGAVY
ncbi:hypothetical protein SBRCBS47491_008639 [Sporothrix bragantina]|uniref:HNH nuclease domain-containing protein n=1 Tax=Sporothrix bragantina TaxID=671064 RepID=A0ABP0CPM3_9PEZI